MQALAPASTVANPSGATATQVRAALQGVSGTRRFTFRYELLTSANVKLLDLTEVLACSVEQNWLADIKRTARFTIRDTGVIDYLSNRIKPYVRLHLPPYGANDWVEWPQGVFLLSSPSRVNDEYGVTTREVDAYDQLQVYADDLTTDRYTVAAGVAYTTAVTTLLGSIPVNLAVSAAVLPVAKEWEPGTSKLKIINELLGAINYNSLSFDENGVAVVSAYQSPQSRGAEYTYADNAQSVIVPGVEQMLDLFKIPNRWTLVVSEPDRSLIVSTYTNTDPASPTSTVRRQRTIVDFRTQQEAVDQGTLDSLAQRLAFEASQVYEAISFTTGLMPIHSGNDVYQITYNPLAIDAKYAEHSWSMELAAGAQMQHRARRVVTV